MSEIRNALVVEDYPVMLERLVELATIPNRVQVVATAPTSDTAIAASDRARIDVAIIDLQLAQGTGFDVIRHLRTAGRHPCAIVVITNHAVPAIKAAAFEAGADYFLDKAKDLTGIPRLLADLLAIAKEQR